MARVLGPYRETMRHIQASQWRAWTEGAQPFWNRRSVTDIPCALMARYKNSAQDQVVAGLNSWPGLTQRAISELVGHSGLSEEDKATQWWLNACGTHQARTASVPVWTRDAGGLLVKSTDKRAATDEELRLLRAMAKHVRTHVVRVPRTWHTRTMALMGTVAQVEHSRESTFDWWARFSTGEAGKPVRVPLVGNPYFDSARGEVCNFTQITVSPEGKISVSLCKQFEWTPLRTQGPDTALDWGLGSLFTTDLGDHLGRSLYPWLLHIDEELLVLTKELQRQGLPLRSNKRYRAFQRRIRSHVRNEVGRVLNRLVSVYGPRSFTVESLDFRYGGLSKRLNRIVTRAGRAAVRSKLQSLREELGIATHEVNPAGTSLECSGCGFIDKRNRRGPRFTCGFCGRSLGSDTNAARVISRRRSSGAADCGVGPRKVLQRADRRFEAAWGLTPGSAERFRMPAGGATSSNSRPKVEGLVRSRA